MAMWLQHLLVIAAVLVCAGVIVRMGVKTLRGWGKLGACCAKGCGASATPPAAEGRVVFMPVEMVRASKGRDRY